MEIKTEFSFNDNVWFICNRGKLRNGVISMMHFKEQTIFKSDTLDVSYLVESGGAGWSPKEIISPLYRTKKELLAYMTAKRKQ